MYILWYVSRRDAIFVFLLIYRVRVYTNVVREPRRGTTTTSTTSVLRMRQFLLQEEGARTRSSWGAQNKRQDAVGRVSRERKRQRAGDLDDSQERCYVRRETN